MPFPTATLTTTQYNKLRGTSSVNPTWSGRVYASLCPNAIVVACRVNGTPTGTSFAGVVYDTVTTGSTGNVEVGMTIIISRTSNIREGYFVGRIREVPDGSSIYINETSAPILDNDYVFVIRDFRLWPVLARDVLSYTIVDWDNVYAALPPAIVGLSDCYAGWADAGTGKLRLSFDISATFATTSGASIASITWTLPASATLVSGTLSSYAITVDFDPSDGEWVKVNALDNAARSMDRHFMVFAHDDAHPPVMSIDALSLSCDLKNGWTGDMTAFDEFDDVLDNTLICLWIDETYNGTQGSLFADTNVPNNIVFVGRLRSEVNPIRADEKHGLVADVRFTLEGLGAQLARMYGALIAEINDASPTLFNYVKNLTIWRGVIQVLAFYTTFMQLHDITFDDTSDTFLCQGLRTQGGNLLDLINDLGQSINAQIEFARSGETRLIRDPRYKSTAARNALLTLANFTISDGIECSLEVEHVKTIGRGDSSGGMYFKSGGIDQVFPVISVAPGMAQDYPDGTTQLTRQVLTANQAVSQAQAELDERAGRQFGIANNNTKLSWTFPDSYWWLTPSMGYWFTYTLAANTNVRGRSFSTANRWLFTGINLSYDPEACTFNPPTGTFILDVNEDTDGASGDPVIYPDPVEVPSPTPPQPVLDPYPGIITDPLPTEPLPFPDPSPSPSLKKNGKEVVIWDDTNVWVCLDFYSPTRTWIDVTPAGGATIRQCLFDPFLDKGLFVLANDGTDSWVYYASNFVTPEWTQGAMEAGLYTEVRATDVSDSIAIYSPSANADAWSHTINTLTDDGGATVTEGVYTAGAGFETTLTINTGYYQSLLFSIPIPSSRTITEISWTFEYTKGSVIPASGELAVSLFANSFSNLLQSVSLDSTPTSPQVWMGSEAGVTVLYFGMIAGLALGHDPGGYGKITSITISGLGGNPFAGSNTAVYDFTTGKHGFDVFQFVGATVPENVGNYVAGTGFIQQTLDGVAFPDNRFVAVRITATLPSTDVTGITFFYENLDKGNDTDPLGENPQGLILINGSVVQTVNLLPNGSGSIAWTGTATATSIDLFLDIGFRSDATTCTGAATIIRAEVVGVDIGVGKATVVVSPDNGESWGIVQPVGDDPGATGGFDTMRVGSVALAAADAQGYKATSLGGTFSSLGTDGATSGSDPRLLLLTWGRMGVASTNNWSTSTPDYILGSAALVGGECLWYVEGSGGRHNITPAGVTGIPSNNCLTTYFGTKAALIANVSGTRHLFTTTNLGSSPTWTDRGSVGANADFVRPLRLSPTLGHLYYVDGTNAKYSLDYGATIVTAPTPCTGTLLGIEVYG